MTAMPPQSELHAIRFDSATVTFSIYATAYNVAGALVMQTAGEPGPIYSGLPAAGLVLAGIPPTVLVLALEYPDQWCDPHSGKPTAGPEGGAHD